MKLLRKTGPVSDSLLAPSAAFCGLGVGVKRRYGSPPSNPPRLSSNVIVVGVVRVVLTRRRGSADFSNVNNFKELNT